MIHIILGRFGEYSDQVVWIVGAFTDENIAKKLAETKKEQDRSNSVIWNAWNTEFHARCRRAGIEGRGSLMPEEREEQAILVGMDPEPKPHGSDETEYTVISVPIDVEGVWEYE